MSRFQKIFLATTLIVVGFGVAKFLGQPVLLPESFRSHSTQPQTAPVATQDVNAKTDASHTANSVLLLPDTPMARSGTAATRSASNMPAVPALGSSLAAVPANDSMNVSSMPRAVDCGPLAPSPIRESDSPRATLRNEAPRAVGVDPHSPAAIRRAPPLSNEVADPYTVTNCTVTNAQTTSVNWPAPPLMNAGIADPPSGPKATAIAASYNQPVNRPIDGQFAPPPWPAAEESTEPRTHIIIDGDTLEKLAGRYLADPKRSREIFELNREVLANPDLLPIGAELKIPERVASAAWDRQNWQPNSSNAKANSEASRDNMMPVRPASAPAGVIPRAQLARPVMVQ